MLVGVCTGVARNNSYKRCVFECFMWNQNTQGRKGINTMYMIRSS